jgi:hypothetical protein
VTLTDADESLHRPPDSSDGHWQENLFFICWDTVALDGLMMHIQRVPGRQVQEARIAVAIAGQHASATLTGPFADDATVDGVTVDVTEPWRRIGIRLAFDATMGCGPGGFIAAHPDGPVSVSVDVELESDLEPVDFAPALARMTSRMRADASAPQMGDQQHYEQGGRWSGTITIGDEHKECAGLFVRDHSWGERHEHNDFRAFWTATCLDDGRVFANAIGIPSGDGVVGIGAIADADGVRFTEEVAATFGPHPGLGTFDRVTVGYGAGIDTEIRGWAQLHWPMYLPFSGRHRFDDNALCIAEGPAGTGFAVMEWAATLDPAMSQALDAAAGPAAAGWLS